MGQICIGKGTAAVSHGEQEASFFFGEMDGDLLPVAIFDGVLHDVLDDFDAAVQVAADEEIGVFLQKKVGFDQGEFFGVVNPDFLHQLL